MQVVVNGQIMVMGWRYENPNLDRILEECNISRTEARQIMETIIPDEKVPGATRRAGVPALCKTLGIKSIPNPTVTYCIISDEQKQPIASAMVRKFPDDPYNPEKARTYSLHKVVRNMFPGLENKETRRKFWEVYLNRKTKKVQEVVNG